MQNPNEEKNGRRDLEGELNQLDAKIAELKMLFEQYFVDILPLPPSDLQREVVMSIRQLQKAPFKNSALRFRLKTLVSRYNTYNTYWERVFKQREEGSYKKDVFKAEYRKKSAETAKRERAASNQNDTGLKQLFATYQEALKKTGASGENLSFDKFKSSLLTRSQELKETKGSGTLSYKVVIQNGKVVVKASLK